jgi:hypothetical protein
MQLINVVPVEGHPDLKLAMWVAVFYDDVVYQDFPGTTEVGVARFVLLPKRTSKSAIEQSNGMPMISEVGHISLGLFKPIYRTYHSTMVRLNYKHELFAMVKYSEITDPEKRRRGLGSAMYVTATRELGALLADTTWSEGAEHLWEKLHTRHKCVSVETWDHVFLTPIAVWNCGKSKQNKFWRQVSEVA